MCKKMTVQYIALLHDSQINEKVTKRLRLLHGYVSDLIPNKENISLLRK
jgi:hypothetical protein